MTLTGALPADSARPEVYEALALAHRLGVRDGMDSGVPARRLTALVSINRSATKRNLRRLRDAGAVASRPGYSREHGRPITVYLPAHLAPEPDTPDYPRPTHIDE